MADRPPPTSRPIPLPTRLYLVRHGRVEDRWRSAIYGDMDVPLSVEGEEQARSVAECLRDVRLDRVVSSGLERAEFGARVLREGRGLERMDEPRLAEMNRGAWRGLTLEEIEQRWPGAWESWWRAPHAERPPGGESVGDLAGRVLPALDELAARHPAGDVAVVAHSWVIRLAATHALGLGPEAVTRFDLPTAGVVVADWPSGLPGSLRRPVLTGFHAPPPPPESRAWFRGPKR